MIKLLLALCFFFNTRNVGIFPRKEFFSTSILGTYSIKSTMKATAVTGDRLGVRKWETTNHIFGDQ